MRDSGSCPLLSVHSSWEVCVAQGFYSDAPPADGLCGMLFLPSFVGSSSELQSGTSFRQNTRFLTQWLQS